jgi:hypothetical protein
MHGQTHIKFSNWYNRLIQYKCSLQVSLYLGQAAQVKQPHFLTVMPSSSGCILHKDVLFLRTYTRLWIPITFESDGYNS